MPVRLAASACFALLLALVGCASETVPPPAPPPQPPPVAGLTPGTPAEARIGLLLPLSGSAEALGEDMLQAAQMALFDVGENRLVLLPRDTGGTPEGAAEAARAALGDGADLIIGPLYSDSVPAVAGVVRQQGAAFGFPPPSSAGTIPPGATPAPPAAAGPGPLPGAPPTGAAAGGPPVKVLAFSNAAEVAAPGVYLLGFRPEEQVERVVRYALDQGLRRIAGLAPDDAYGALAMEALRRTVVEGGGELGPIRFYPPNQAIPSEIVRDLAGVDERLRELEQSTGPGAGGPGAPPPRALEGGAIGPPPFDAILLADGGNRLRGVASLLTYYDVDPTRVRYLGTWRWQDDDPEALQDAALQGGWFAAPSPQGIGSFRSRFAATFGREPEPLAALAYDATALAAIVARDLGGTPGFDDGALTTAEGFLGASGPFRLRPDGLAEHGLAVLQVGPGGATEVISEPPTSFAAGVAAVP